MATILDWASGITKFDTIKFCLSYQCQTPDCALHLSAAAFPATCAVPCLSGAPVDVQATDEPTVSRSDFEQRVLDRYPYVIALPYQNMLNEQDGRGRLIVGPPFRMH